MILIVLIQMFLMFEVVGRTEKRFDAGKLKKIHRINAVIFILLYFFIAFFCLRYIADSKDELSPRVALHGLLAFSVIILLALKISFIRIYRQFYSKALTLGPLIALLTFGMVASSGGFYFLVTIF
jgi:hypothetical protein